MTANRRQIENKINNLNERIGSTESTGSIQAHGTHYLFPMNSWLYSTICKRLASHNISRTIPVSTAFSNDFLYRFYFPAKLKSSVQINKKSNRRVLKFSFLCDSSPVQWSSQRRKNQVEARHTLTVFALLRVLRKNVQFVQMSKLLNLSFVYEKSRIKTQTANEFGEKLKMRK